MKSHLCRHCFKRFAADRIHVLCRSSVCSRTLDDRGQVGPRFMNPREVGLWRRFRRRLDLGAPCPVCEQVGTLVPACPWCRGQLDVSLDASESREDRVVAVIGASGSGKSHYLAAVLFRFLEEQEDSLSNLWRASMTREDLALYRRHFQRRLFEDQEELAGNSADLGPELRLLLEDRARRRKTLVIFRDLGGELFADRKRLKELSFLRYAQGVVLMVDPLAYSPPVGSPASWEPSRQPMASQILEIYRQMLAEQDRYAEHRELPLLPEEKILAVAVTKADLILQEDHPFWNGGAAGTHLQPGYWTQRRPDSGEVRRWIHESLDVSLAEVADAFGDAGYFFVSSFGYPHEPNSGLAGPPRPLRVHEPIFALLDRLGYSGSEDEDFDAGL